MIASFGGDSAELHSAVCIELNPDPEKRKECLFFVIVFEHKINRENIFFIFNKKSKT